MNIVTRFTHVLATTAVVASTLLSNSAQAATFTFSQNFVAPSPGFQVPSLYGTLSGSFSYADDSLTSVTSSDLSNFQATFNFTDFVFVPNSPNPVTYPVTIPLNGPPISFLFAPTTPPRLQFSTGAPGFGGMVNMALDSEGGGLVLLRNFGGRARGDLRFIPTSGVSVEQAAAVPEPTTVLGTLAAGAFLGRWRKRQTAASTR